MDETRLESALRDLGFEGALTLLSSIWPERVESLRIRKADEKIPEMKMARPNYFIGLELDGGEKLHDEVDYILGEILERHEGRIDRKAASSFAKLHITLGLLSIEEDASQDMQTKLKCIRDIIYRTAASTLNVHTSVLPLTLTGLNSFPGGSGKQKQRVVFMEPLGDTSTQILKLFAKSLISEISEHVTCCKATCSDVLHLTILKTRHPQIIKSHLDDLFREPSIVTTCKSIKVYKIGSTDSSSGAYLSYGGVHLHTDGGYILVEK